MFQALRDHGVDFIKTPTLAEMLQWADALIHLYDRPGKLPDSKSWADLPGITCLLKHKHDLATVAADVDEGKRTVACVVTCGSR